MSVSNMLTAATLPISDPNSLFVDPSAPGCSELQLIKSSISSMYTSSPDFDPLANPLDLSCFDAATNDPTYPSGGLITTIQSHMSTKISSIGTDLPLMNAASQTNQRITAIDATLAGQPAPVVTNDCDNLMSLAFQTLKEVGSFIGGVATAIYDMFSTLLSPLFGTISTIIGSVISTVKDVFAAIAGPFGSSILSTIGSALGGITSIIGDVVSSIETAIAAFATKIAEEAAVIASALGNLINFSFLNSLNIANPCVQSIHGAIINQNNIDPTALVALATPV